MLSFIRVLASFWVMCKVMDASRIGISGHIQGRECNFTASYMQYSLIHGLMIPGRSI